MALRWFVPLLVVTVFLNAAAPGSLLATPRQDTPPSPPQTPASQPEQESESPENQDPEEAAQEPDYDAQFMEMVAERQANEQRITWLFANMPIGFVERQRKFRDEIQQLKDRNAELDRMIQEVAADALLKSDVELKPTMAQYLARLVEKKMSGKDPAIPFDPKGARRMVRALILRLPKERSLNLLAYRADYLAEDFESALKWLERAKLAGIRFDPKLEKETQQMLALWQREQALRERDRQADDLPRVVLETDVGNITLELFENEAPNSVANFVSLVEQGFYDGQIFYRVTPSMLVQTGCPNGDGTGDPGYKIANENDRPEIRHFFTGTVGMYLAEDGTAGSQFFIVKQPAPFLNSRFTAFARVIDGIDAVYKIQVIDMTTRNRDPNIQPTTLQSARVVRKRDHEYAPVKLGESSSANQSSQGDGQSNEESGKQNEGNDN